VLKGRINERAEPWLLLGAGVAGVLLWRAIVVARSDTRTRLGGPAGTLVEDAMTIDVPIADAYRGWRESADLPRFIADAQVINEEPNCRIAWQSIPGARLSSAGSVTFSSDSRGTTVRVRFQYDLPSGKAGNALTRMLGAGPAGEVREFLRRLKQQLEAGEIASTGGQPKGRS
jgi:uncharacterized membrane protein